MAKMKRILSDIHKGMTLCANWHFWEVNTLLAPCHLHPKSKSPCNVKNVSIIAPSLFVGVKRDRRSMMKSERNMVTAIYFLLRCHEKIKKLFEYTMYLLLDYCSNSTPLHSCFECHTFFLALSSTCEQFYHLW